MVIMWCEALGTGILYVLIHNNIVQKLQILITYNLISVFAKIFIFNLFLMVNKIICAIGKAVHYSLHIWNKLCGYTKHGGLEIDNNLIENLIRPLALGRKNYIAGSHQGARNIAITYSLLGSCKLNGLDPYEYLMAVLKKLPDYPISKISDLLPCYVRFEKPTTLEYKRV